MIKEIVFGIFFLLKIIKASNEPMLDILNNYRTVKVSENCTRDLNILKNASESHEIWAIKGKELLNKFLMILINT